MFQREFWYLVKGLESTLTDALQLVATEVECRQRVVLREPFKYVTVQVFQPSIRHR